MKCYIKNTYTNNLYLKEDWKRDYNEELESIIRYKSVYKDPDTNSEEFYEELANFLNKMEQDSELSSNLIGKFIYKANGTIIEVTNTEMKPLFKLKSDQFGFSKPSIEKKHIYDIYLEYGKDDIETKKDNICNWIYDSRSIGGSFLWDSELYKSYNPNRGGSKNSKSINYYIEDRVDITLLEIKLYYEYKIKRDADNLFKKTILYTSLNKKVKNIWLDHFKNFETYIKFMKLDNFINENGMPIDIVHSDLVKNKKIKSLDYDIIRNKMRELYSDNINIKQVLNNVNDLIRTRSEKIIEKE